MRRSFPALLVVCTLAALVAGCGSSGGTETSNSAEGAVMKKLPRPTHTLNKAEFIKFSRPVCANITREIDQGFERFASEHGIESGERPTPAEIREIGEELQLPLMHKQDRELINAGKAPAIQDELLKILYLAEEEVRKWSSRPAVAATDPGRVWAKVNPRLRHFGLVTCVREEPLVD